MKTVRKVLEPLALASAISMAAHAQEPSHNIEIQSQSLGTALNQLSTQTGTVIIAPTDLIQGLTSSSLTGEHTSLTAVKKLLENSGLTVHQTSSGTLVISAPDDKQSAAAPREQEKASLQSIVVTGELINRNLQDTVTSANIEMGAQLEQRGDNKLDASTQRMGNVFSNGFNFTIRGITTSGPSNTGRGQTITTTIDGARVSNFFDQNVTTYSTWDLAQIEVLRGPQSTQTGRNALAGAVTINSQDPIFDQETKIRLGSAEGGTRQAAFAMNTELQEDVLALRLSGEVLDSDGFTDYPNTRTHTGDTDRETLRAGLLWQPNEKASALLKVTRVDQSEPTTEVDRTTYPDRVVTRDFPGSYEKDLTSVNLDISYEISDILHFESSTNHTKLDTAFAVDPDGTAFNAGEAIRSNYNDALEQELRLRFETDRVNAVVGLFYTNLDSSGRTLGTSPAALLPLPFPLPPTAEVVFEASSTEDTTNKAIFGEIEYEVVDNLRVTLGARYDTEEIESTFDAVGNIVNNGVVIAPLPTNPEPPTTTKFNAFLPKVGMAYDLDDAQTIGFTYQQGYRAGGRRTNLGATPFYTYTFDPEYTDNYEIAYRSEWNDGDLTVNANIFYTDWKDQQVTVAQSTTPNDFIIDNSGASRLWGGELEIRNMPSDALDLYASLGYANSEFTDFVANTGDFSGNEFLYSPNWNGAVGGTYELSNNWMLGADLSYTSSTFSDVANAESNKNDAYWLTNVRATKSFNNGLKVTAYVNNLFDEDYTTFANATAVTPGAPREIGFFMQMNF